MPWCPSCRSEYLPHIVSCSECEEELVPELPPGEEPMPTESVFRAGDEMTAVNIANILRDAGIEAHILSRQVPMYDGIFALGQGFWGEVLVPKSDAPRSLDILSDYLAHCEEE